MTEVKTPSMADDTQISGELVECHVSALEELTPGLFRLRLHPPRPMQAVSGQFAMLRPLGFTYHPLLGRPMSILGCGNQLDFLVRRCGGGTQILTSLRPGSRVEFLGPLGHGWGEPPTRNQLVLVAGGVGLAPLLFAADEIASRTPNASRPILIYGARSASELVMLDDISRVSELKVATDDGSQGHQGPVTDLLERILDNNPSAVVWACGPEGMMKRTAAISSERGVTCKVSIEERMACGRGLCLGCARIDSAGHPSYVCRDGPVFDSLKIYGDRKRLSS